MRALHQGLIKSFDLQMLHFCQEGLLDVEVTLSQHVYFLAVAVADHDLACARPELLGDSAVGGPIVVQLLGARDVVHQVHLLDPVLLLQVLVPVIDHQVPRSLQRLHMITFVVVHFEELVLRYHLLPETNIVQLCRYDLLQFELAQYSILQRIVKVEI